MSPNLCAIFMDGLLDRFADTGVGCHMGICFIGVMVFADNLNLLFPTISGLKVLAGVYE